MARAKSKEAGKETTRQVLLDAAKALFERKGYQAASTDEIARKAGVSKGTVYFYFKRKDDLFLAVVERELERIGRMAHDSLSAAGAPSEALLTVIDQMLSGRWPLMELAQVVQTMWVHAPGELRSKFSGLLKEVYGDHREIAAQMLGKADLPPRLRAIDREVLAYLLIGCVEGLWHAAMLEGKGFPLKKVVEALGTVFLGARG